MLILGTKSIFCPILNSLVESPHQVSRTMRFYMQVRTLETYYSSKFYILTNKKYYFSNNNYTSFNWLVYAEQQRHCQFSNVCNTVILNNNKCTLDLSRINISNIHLNAPLLVVFLHLSPT